MIDSLGGRELIRRILKLRYVEGCRLPQIRETLDAEGLFYGDRHIDRVLRWGEQALAAAWAAGKEEKKP